MKKNYATRIRKLSRLYYTKAILMSSIYIYITQITQFSVNLFHIEKIEPNLLEFHSLSLKKSPEHRH